MRKASAKQSEFLQKMIWIGSTLMIYIDALVKTQKRNKKIIMKQKEACTIDMSTYNSYSIYIYICKKGTTATVTAFNKP